MRSPLLALLLLPAAAGAAPKQRIAATDLPRVKAVEAFPEPSPFATLSVELDAQGGLSLDGTRATLDEVDARILFVTEQRGIHLRRKGGDQAERLPTGMEASPVVVHLRVHKDAPWRHVQYLLTLLAQRRAYRTEFVATDAAGKEGVVRAWLPLDVRGEGGLELGEEEETEKAPPERPGVLTLTFLAEGERDAKFQGKPVRAPGAIAFAVGKKKTPDRERFLSMVAEELGARKVRTLEVRAEGRVPAGEVVAAVGEARAAGQERVDLYRPVALGSELRSAPALPYPEPSR